MRFPSHYWLPCLLSAMIGCGPANAPKNSAPGGAKNSEPGADKKLRIAVIPKGTGHEFWKSVHAGAQRAADEFGVEITWKGPQAEGNTTDQITVLENLLADGYDAICIAPLDAQALRKPINRAIEAERPVVIFDSALKDMSGITSYVATNNKRGGEVAGKYLGELLNGKGKVILMRYGINSESTEQREAGFLEALAKSPDIQLLSSDKHGGPDEAAAVTLSEQLLANFGDQVDGIFCPNESTASGMLTVLERDSRGLAGKVKLVGFDSSTNLVNGMTRGHLNGTVLQDPVQMGYDAVRVAVDKLKGRAVPERIEVPENLATTQNMNDPKIHRLLYPDKAD